MKHLAALFLFVSAGFAQDVEPEFPRDANALLTDAVLHFRAQNDLVVRAAIKHEKPEAKQGQPGVAGVVVVAGPGGVASQPYEGEVEAWRGADGVTVILSSDQVPGFGIYSSEEKTIRQVTYDDKPPGLKQLEAELASMLETERFVKQVMAAHTAGKFRSTRLDNGDVRFSGPIEREIVRPVSNAIEVQGFVVGNLGMQPRVLRAEATFTVTKDGKFRSVAVKLVRTDPMSKMLRAGQIRVQGGGVVWPPEGQKKEKKKDEEHDVEGGSTTYTLSFGDNRPSERARAFKRKIARKIADR